MLLYNSRSFLSTVYLFGLVWKYKIRISGISWIILSDSLLLNKHLHVKENHTEMLKILNCIYNEEESKPDYIVLYSVILSVVKVQYSGKI